MIITEQYITQNWDNIKWYQISRVMPEDLIKRYVLKVDWGHLSCRTDLSDEFLAQYDGWIVWKNWLPNNLSRINTEFIQKHPTLNWNLISLHAYSLPEHFLREWKDYVKWDWLNSPDLVLNKFSIDFLREFYDKFDWEYLIGMKETTQRCSINQKIKNIIKEFGTELNNEL